MKKKAIIIVIIIMCVLGLATLGYIITNNFINDEANNNDIINNIDNIENDGKDYEVTDNKDSYENIVLNSRIGLRILEKFNISNIYSDLLYDEIDNNGLSNKAKLLFTYITILTDMDAYYGILRESENYTGSYITKNDFENVAKKLFGQNLVLNHADVVGENSYDESAGNYVIMPIGFAGESINFTIEVPYEIKEYSDRVEVDFYRIYCTQYSDTESIDGKMYTKLFYDKERSIEIEDTDNEEMLDPETQNSYINKKIEDGMIDKSKLDKKSHTLKNEDGNYIILK